MKRKRSAAVTLVLSGSLLAGCNNSSTSSGWGDSNTLTKNTYNPAYGYWHSYYHQWYPYPHNFYDPMRGFYYGGRWSLMADSNPTPPTAPEVSGSSSHVGSGYSGGSSGSSSHSSGGISRGGFGSSGHASS